MKTLATLAAVLIALAALAAAAAYSGVYNVAADEPHWALTERALAFARDRSIATHGEAITPPRDLADPQRVLAGAGQYAEMCESCHLAPGVEDTELRKGLNPKPPALARQRREPRQAFWIVKHGIKASGMPAWGLTHDDETMWDIVAFLEKLPQLDAKGYRTLVAKAPAHEEAESAGHSHAPGTAPHRD